MRFGLHVSIAGGLPRVAERAVKAGCETVQIFSHNPRSWLVAPLKKTDVLALKTALSQADIAPLCVHMPYLPNLAASDSGLYKKSIRLLRENVVRANMLGARYLVVHPGSIGVKSIQEGIGRIGGALRSALGKADAGSMILLENTAGQGSEVGYNFLQLRGILDAAGGDRRLGICLDTAHAFAAGYVLNTADGLSDTLEELAAVIGLERLQLLHLNDTRKALGSGVDRHWHIGRGNIGREGFRLIVNHPLLRKLPAIMETPKQTEADDRRNMRAVRRLVEPVC